MAQHWIESKTRLNIGIKIISSNGIPSSNGILCVTLYDDDDDDDHLMMRMTMMTL